ncbi:hypothetical protein HYALB_00007558 [Hymenoscyphus albidus]|uniref:Uncharacterized protein n=1 Tax=Hymenoscyphus albidus TaxID=595503 RepID=A0A9N9LNZ3_9HELO|nr:hypothetical protein HYALB_00007558 [Hymenoscyphus albidus]
MALSSGSVSLLTICYDVRAKILEYVLSSPRRIRPRWPPGLQYPYHDIVSVSLACWQLHDEAKPIFYKQNTFYINFPIDYRQFNHRTGDGDILPALIKSTEPRAQEPLIQNCALLALTPFFWESNDFFDHSRVSTSSWMELSINHCLRNQLFVRMGKYKSFELVFKMAHSFKLCEGHLKHHLKFLYNITKERYVEKYFSLFNTKQHMSGEQACTTKMSADNRARFASRACFPYNSRHPARSAREQDAFVEEKLNLGFIMRHVLGIDFTISWDSFQWNGPPQQEGTAKRIGCDWARLDWLIQFHLTFGQGDVSARKRLGWLLYMGHSDVRNLREGLAKGRKKPIDMPSSV